MSERVIGVVCYIRSFAYSPFHSLTLEKQPAYPHRLDLLRLGKLCPCARDRFQYFPGLFFGDSAQRNRWSSDQFSGTFHQKLGFVFVYDLGGFSVYGPLIPYLHRHCRL